jgi:hypothetical protein
MPEKEKDPNDRKKNETHMLDVNIYFHSQIHKTISITHSTAKK